MTIAATGLQTAFVFPFVGVAASDISVSSIASNGAVTTLATSQYTLSLNTASSNQLWGIGGTVNFTSAPAAGTSVLIQRVIPYTQQTSVQNQGNYYAQVTEQALDILCMEIQQLLGRTTQFRGTWQTNTAYNIGDIVQDGINGANTLNYYICAIANTSGTWATDLANGDWAVSVLATVPTTNQPITLTGAISGSGTSSIATGINANQVTTSSIISGGVTLPKLATIGPNTVLCNSSGTSGTPGTIALSANSVFGMSSGNLAALTIAAPLSTGSTTFSLNTQPITNSIAGDVSLTSTGAYFDGPSIAQGTSGTWYVSGSVSVLDTGGNATFNAKLWDGTTVIASARADSSGASRYFVISLSGQLSNPAGNLRISVQDTSGTTGAIKANGSGNSKDSTITAIRIG